MYTYYLQNTATGTILGPVQANEPAQAIRVVRALKSTFGGRILACTPEGELALSRH
jgi:hypothetical protein